MTQEEREDILRVISDLSKDAFGFRVRRDYAAMSDDELQKTWDSYYEALEATQKREAEEAADALVAFNATLDRLCRDHRISRRTAARWLRQGDKCERQEPDYWLWKHGLAMPDRKRIIADLRLR